MMFRLLGHRTMPATAAAGGMKASIMRQSTDAAAAAAAAAAVAAAAPPPHSQPQRSHHRSSRPHAPPLVILSWSVDGMQHTHHRCRRRRPLAERIPGIVRTIQAAAPDVVALQDSTADVAAALTGSAKPQPIMIAQEEEQQLMRSLTNQLTTLRKWRAAAASRWLPKEAATAAQDKGAGLEGGDSAGAALAEEEAESDGTVTSSPWAVSSATVHPSYTFVGSARNGRCGEVQLYLRSDSPWQGRLLPANPGATMELLCSTEGHAHAGEEVGEAPRRLRFTLTNVDLTYRGKSLAVGGKMLVSSEVSRDGDPFRLTMDKQRHHSPPTTARTAGGADAAAVSVASGRNRAKGTVDAHREIALKFLSRVTRPSLLVGNFFMGKAESMPAEGKHAYADAWVMAGSLPHQERTINTFATHARDRLTNYFYFVPSMGVTQAGRDRTLSGSVADDGAGEGAAPKPVEQTDIGARLPLDACLTHQGKWRVREAAGEGDEGQATPHAGEARGSDVADSDAWLQEQMAKDAATPGGPTVGVPEVAGRAQRCFVRRYVGQPSSVSAAATDTQEEETAEDLPVSQVFRRCCVMVLKGFTEAGIGPAEAAWHHARKVKRQPRRGERAAMPKATAETGDEEAASETSPGSDGGGGGAAGGSEGELPRKVPCSLADQYPLLIFLS